MILVTGANGFVGQRLVGRLVEEGCAVRPASRHEHHIAGIPSAHSPLLTDHADWNPLLKGVSQVVHLAARVHVMRDHSQTPLDDYLRVNRDGTLRLAKQAAQAGVQRFVLISTIKVNGETTLLREPFSEMDIPAPIDPYAISKWQAEQALQELALNTGMDVVVLRPPLMYGPYVRANFLALLRAVWRGVPLPLAGADSLRSLLFVDNFVSAIHAVLSCPDRLNQTFLVSDGDDISLAMLLREMAAVMQCSARLWHIPPHFLHTVARLVGKRSVSQRLLDPLQINSARIRERLGWQPPFTRHQGLQMTAEWFVRSMQELRNA